MQSFKEQKNLSLESINNFRENILEKFLLTANTLEQDLRLLLHNGFDERKLLCIDKAIEHRYDFRYSYLSKNMVKSFHFSLSRMLRKSSQDMPKKYLSLATGAYMTLSFEYPSINVLISLATAYQDLTEVITLIESLDELAEI